MRACRLLWQSAGSNRRRDCRRKHATDLNRMWAGGWSHVHLLLRFNVQVSRYSQSSTAALTVRRVFCQTSSVCAVATYRGRVDGKGWGV